MKKHILIVEYAIATVDIIKELLSHPIFELTVLDEGEKAKAMLETRTFDMVITAAMLPKFHGFNLSQLVATQYPDTKIIIISEIYKGMDYRQQAINQYRANDFFEKPFNRDLFKKRILQLLGLNEDQLGDGVPAGTAQIPLPDTAKVPTLQKIAEEEKKLSSEDIFGDIIDKVHESPFEIDLANKKKKAASETGEKPPAKKATEVSVPPTAKDQSSLLSQANGMDDLKKTPPKPKPQEDVAATQFLSNRELIQQLKISDKPREASPAATQRVDLDLDSLLKSASPAKPKKQNLKKIEDDISKRWDETLSGLGLPKSPAATAKPKQPPVQRQAPAPVPPMPPKPQQQVIPPPPAPAPAAPPVAKVPPAPAPTPPKAAPAPVEDVKEEVGGYEVLGLIARGGMAEIYKAKRKGLKGFEKVIALKKILSGLGKDDKYIEMFVDEAKIAAELSHPNIVPIYDLGKKDDYYFIAMEYVFGKDLRLILQKVSDSDKELPEELALYMVIKVLEALNYAHAAKNSAGQSLDIVHRDISPPNILVSFSGDVKLTDFGVSKASIKIHHTIAGALKGKLLYMSPEQARGDEDIDYRADLFSVGIILFELITGQKLFMSSSEMAVLKKVQEGDIIKPTSLKQNIKPQLEKIILRLLHKDKTQRYQKASDVIKDLEAYILSNYDHIPDSSHLSHFIHLLFIDEIRKEGFKIDLKPIPYEVKRIVRGRSDKEDEIMVLDEDSLAGEPEPFVKTESIQSKAKKPTEIKTEKLVKESPTPQPKPESVPEPERKTQEIPYTPAPPPPPSAPSAKQQEEEFHPLIEIDLGDDGGSEAPAPPPPPTVPPSTPQPADLKPEPPVKAEEPELLDEPLPVEEESLEEMIGMKSATTASEGTNDTFPLTQSGFTTDEENEFQKKKKLLIIAAAAVVVLAITIGLILFLGSGDEPPVIDTGKTASIGETNGAKTSESPAGVPQESAAIDPAASTGEDSTAGTGEDVSTEPGSDLTAGTNTELGAVKSDSDKTSDRSDLKETDQEKPLISEKKKASDEQETRDKSVDKQKEESKSKAEDAQVEPKKKPQVKEVTPEPTDEMKAEAEAQARKEQEAKLQKEKEEAERKKREAAEAEKRRIAEMNKVKVGQIVAPMELDSPLEVVSKKQIKISSRMQRSLKKSVTILVRYKVGPNGSVEEVGISPKNLPKKIMNSIEKTVMTWTFKPPTKNGIKVRVWQSFTVGIRKM